MKHTFRYPTQNITKNLILTPYLTLLWTFSKKWYRKWIQKVEKHLFRQPTWTFAQNWIFTPPLQHQFTFDLRVKISSKINSVPAKATNDQISGFWPPWNVPRSQKRYMGSKALTNKLKIHNIRKLSYKKKQFFQNHNLLLFIFF